MDPMLANALRDQFSTTTWLLIGASLQTACFALLPFQYAATLPLGGLAYLITRTTLQTTRWISHYPSPPIIKGRYTARPPSSVLTADPQPVVVFILGFQSSHPLGRLGPGAKEVGDYFQGIMKEAAAQRETTGFLGTSSPMLTMDGGSDNALITISYWSDLARLEEYSKRGIHLKALKWWNEMSSKFPHLGIMHETYACPAGSYETVYHNFRPFGFVNTAYEVDNELGEKEVVKADLVREGTGIETMRERMSGLTKSG